MNGFNLSTIMYSWTRQSGHPIITVKRFNTTHISVSQAPFSIASAMEGLVFLNSIDKLLSKVKAIMENKNPFILGLKNGIFPLAT